jgi:hypothetical protein
MIAVKTKQAMMLLERERSAIRKEYLCVVRGSPLRNSGLFTRYYAFSSRLFMINSYLNYFNQGTIKHEIAANFRSESKGKILLFYHFSS